MAPAKTSTRRPVSTRTQPKLSILGENAQNIMPLVGKRKADASPVRNEKTVKRAALGNVTNAVLNAIDDDKKSTNRAKNALTKKSTATTQVLNDENVAASVLEAMVKAVRASKVVTRASSRAIETIKSSNVVEAINGTRKPKTTKTNGKLEVVQENGNNKETNNNNNNNVQKDRRNSQRLSNESENSHYESALDNL